MIVLISSLTSTFGAATGVMKWRGDYYQEEERHSVVMRIRLKRIDEELAKSYNDYEILEKQRQSLPDDTPKELYDKLCELQIQELTRQEKLRESRTKLLFDETISSLY